MLNFSRLFCERLGIPFVNSISYDDLNAILEKTAKTIPFENLNIINKLTKEITKDNLINKIIHQNEGGLCYELNSLFYFFLTENGFDAKLIRGLRYDYSSKSWSNLGKTHVAILLTYNDNVQLVDVGFGGNSPLTMVPLSGEKITSHNGEFKVINFESEHGDFIFCMKLKDKDTEWTYGYAFDSKNPIMDLSELNEVQKINIEHPEAKFNKKPIITKFLDNGIITVTDTSFTERVNGQVEKTEIDRVEFRNVVRKHFGF